MKKISLAVIFALLISIFPGYGKAALAEEIGDFSMRQPFVSADSAILMDLKTGQILYAKNPFKKRPPASTTKIMTALIALEAGKLNDIVTVSKKAAYTEGSSMYLKTGEKLRMSDLLYGALMNSGNDACVAMAEHIAGSEKNFAELMNIKALSLGTVNTHFANPHGLPNKAHYTCAYDLALIAKKALQNQLFAQIVSTRSKLLEWPGQKWDRRLENTNKLLWSYLWADGVKTGTTSAAGQCLISSASKGSRRLVAVVLRSGDRWKDSIKMFEYGFNSFQYRQVAVSGAQYGKYNVQNGNKNDVTIIYGSDHSVLLPEGSDSALEKRVYLDTYPVAPIKKGQVIGSICYYVNGKYAGMVSLLAGEDVDEIGLFDMLIKWLVSKISIIGQIDLVS